MRPSPFAWLARVVLRRPRTIVVLWTAALIAGAPFALRLVRIAQGGSEAIRGSEAHAVMTTVDRAFGRGFAQLVPVVLTHEKLTAADPEFARAVERIAARLDAASEIRGVFHPWNSGLPELIGRDGHSVLLLVQPDARTLAEAEALTASLRFLVRPAALPAGFSATVTGMSSTYHDINHQSAADLLRAEMVGVPLTLVVLFLVFRTAVAAGLALAMAGAAVTLSSAVLCLFSPWLPPSVLAQNVITMIGLGAGTDYALFLLSHYRQERARGLATAEAITRTFCEAGPAVLVAGLAVVGGFGALFLVNARFVHSLAFGGVLVIAIALAATFTLLPALLHFAGDRTLAKRERGSAVVVSDNSDTRTLAWSRWAGVVMRRPWSFLALAVGISGVFAWPATRTEVWSIGPRDLPVGNESRDGFEALTRNFEAGWMAPIVITIESSSAQGVWEMPAQLAALALATELRDDQRIAQVMGFPRLLELLGDARETIRDIANLRGPLAGAARTVVSVDGRTALLLVVARESPAARSSIELVDSLRARVRPEAAAAGVQIKIGGGPALIRDFDAEMFSSVGRVALAVLLLTFVLLLVYFRSIAVPLKAMAANLLSVLAAYGFLVLVFQDGTGAALIGITPPGGLNSFVVLMLFTILFGLSMDYEIFLLSRMRDEFVARRDNTAAVGAGLAGTAGIITSAAAIMVCLFGSFGFFGLTASRQFGLGLAFAVAFDATVVRLLIVPATMRLLGRWNWWLPSFRGRRSNAGGKVASEAEREFVLPK